MKELALVCFNLIFKKFNVAEDDNTSSPKAEIGPAVNPEFDSSFAVTINWDLDALLLEGKIVSNLIFEEKNRNQLTNSNFAILYRTNSQSRSIEEALRRIKVLSILYYFNVNSNTIDLLYDKITN